MIEKAQVFTGEGINRFQIIVVKNAIKLYRDHGMKANRDYTPRNMRLMAEKLTGKKFKTRDWNGMVEALEELLQ